jgi:uncharacterized phosphatase
MKPTEFIFVRHGQSQANADGMIADESSPLTEKGFEQARETGKKLKHLGITTIVSSPILRAHQTAEAIAGELGIDSAQIQVMDELRERDFGELKGKPKTQASEWYTVTDAPTLEPRQALLERMHLALEKIEALSNEGLVLVVGHAVSGLFLFEAANGVTTVADMTNDAQIGNADFVKVQIQNK